MIFDMSGTDKQQCQCHLFALQRVLVVASGQLYGEKARTNFEIVAVPVDFSTNMLPQYRIHLGSDQSVSGAFRLIPARAR